MTRDKVKEVLLNGCMVRYSSWIWSQYHMSCGSSDGDYTCCEDSFNDAEEALSDIELYLLDGDDWQNVEEV